MLRKTSGKQSSPREWPLYVRQNLQTVWLLAALTAGVAFGALLLRFPGAGRAADASLLCRAFWSRRQSAGFFSNLLHALAGSCAFLAPVLFSGLCLPGRPLTLLLMFFRGMGFGLCAGALYASRGWLGAAAVLTVLLPGALVSLTALLFAGWQAWAFAGRLRGQFLSSPPRWQPRQELRRYVLLGACSGGLTLLAALLDSVASQCFMPLFSV